MLGHSRHSKKNLNITHHSIVWSPYWTDFTHFFYCSQFFTSLQSLTSLTLVCWFLLQIENFYQMMLNFVLTSLNPKLLFGRDQNVHNSAFSVLSSSWNLYHGHSSRWECLTCVCKYLMGFVSNLRGKLPRVLLWKASSSLYSQPITWKQSWQSILPNINIKDLSSFLLLVRQISLTNRLPPSNLYWHLVFGCALRRMFYLWLQAFVKLATQISFTN